MNLTRASAGQIHHSCKLQAASYKPQANPEPRIEGDGVTGGQKKPGSHRSGFFLSLEACSLPLGSNPKPFDIPCEHSELVGQLVFHAFLGYEVGGGAAGEDHQAAVLQAQGHAGGVDAAIPVAE